MKLNTLESIQKDFEVLNENPKLINNNWGVASPLFNFVGDDIGYSLSHEANVASGCLTQIRADSGKTLVAFLKGFPHIALTEEIVNDVRLPFIYSEVMLGHLPVFKEWQERILEMEEKGEYIPKDPSTLVQIDAELLNYYKQVEDDDFDEDNSDDSLDDED